MAVAAVAFLVCAETWIRFDSRSEATVRRAADGPLRLVALATVGAAAIGLGLGDARLEAINRGALWLPAGERARITGFLSASPDRGGGSVDLRVETAAGRLLVRAPEPVPELSAGDRVRATGAVREPAEWEAARLERLGIARVLAARRIEPLAGTRPGLDGALDQIRRRAETALGDGTSAHAAALLRGFVLGQDDRIVAATVDDFKRSGLAHLLAVSGQNVILLALLTAAVLAVLGVRLRARLLLILAAIAIYVPVAGAGPSIQRAGVMGAAGVVAALAGRPTSRWYALLLAAAATLTLDPRASADIGWQLSFAAVAGILLLARPLIAALGAGGAGGDAGGSGGGPGGPARRLLAEGFALTVAATLATAPLMALHFGSISVLALPANLVALPAEAPVMWLGMLAAAAGQVPGAPLEPLTWLAGACAGYIASVAGLFAAPAWSVAEVSTGGIPLLIALHAAGAAGIVVAVRALRRRHGLNARGSPAALIAATLALALALALAVTLSGGGGTSDAANPGLRLTMLDVGQGDAILLEPRDGDPVLVDAGPVDGGVADELRERRVESLAMLVITHPEADHDGGAAAVLEQVPTRRLAFGHARPELLGLAQATGAERVRVTAGDLLRSGSLRLRVLWPPAERLAAPAAREDPNLAALVLRARWRGFDALLTADAEAETAPLDPGPVELLKVAHHGSADAGLDSLLARLRPQLALISVGAGNPYGHPAPATLESLAEAGAPVLRTDLAGSIEIEVAGGAWRVSG